MLVIREMERDNSNRFFTRSNVLLWTPAILGMLFVQIIFGWKNGVSGILWNVLPVIIGISVCLGFLRFGKYLTTRVSWPIQLLVLVSSSIVLVLIGFVLLIALTAADPATEFVSFLPGRTIFWLVLFFSALLILLGFIPRLGWRKSGPQADD